MSLQAMLQGFGQEGAGGGSGGALASLKAGRMHADREGAQYSLRADARRGELRVTRAGDGLVHLMWRDRTSGAQEEDFIVMPGDVTLR